MKLIIWETFNHVNQMKTVILSALCVLAYLTSFSQNGDYSGRGGPSAYSPSSEKSDIKYKAEKKGNSRKKLKKSFTYQFNKHHDDLVDEFYERIEDNAKRKKKIARKMKKPQYSDPTYLGHKRKPKKRPVGKRKFCKECGIEH